MSIRFAINGVGRIVRALVRAASESSNLEFVACNDLAPVEQWAPLLARDSLHGPFPGTVRATTSSVFLDDHEIATFRVPEPAEILLLDKG